MTAPAPAPARRPEVRRPRRTRTDTAREQQPTRRFLDGVLACPSCGNDHLEVVVDEAAIDRYDTNFVCHACRTSWHWTFGYLIAVDGPDRPR